MTRCYVFGDFRLSPARRLLTREGREVPLIPRYLDLLVLLVQRRDEAISRRVILDAVWTDVVVSDGALSQAVRTLRRALGDDSREPKFIRTVSRHGYQFVFSHVVEEPDTAPIETTGSTPGPNDVDLEWAVLVDPTRSEDDRRVAAERLHQAGTAEAVKRLELGHGTSDVRALLRDARWDVPGAGRVPILGRPRALRTLLTLFNLRLRRVWRVAGNRYMTALVGAIASGFAAGLAGGLALYLGPGSEATPAVLALLPIVGVSIAAVGASGVAAGLCCAEVLIRSRRGTALVLLAAVGGGVVGAVAHALGALALSGLFGQDLSPAAGGLEGAVLGAATGLGYALATPRAGGGMATPHGGERWIAVLLAGGCCAAAAAILSGSGSYLGAMSLDLLAHSFPGSQVGLDPLARLLGESSPGPLTRVAIGAWEGLMFASGTVLGLTRRPN
jgi:DNA-binding winged helix-turn-helix (wHTH) protein